MVDVSLVCATSLLNHCINFILILHIQIRRCLIGSESLSIEQESYGFEVRTNLLTVCTHHLAELSRLLHLEINLIAVLCFDFEIEMLRWCRLIGLLALLTVRCRIVLRHDDELSIDSKE